jgi:hypothetical protein
MCGEFSKLDLLERQVILYSGQNAQMVQKIVKFIKECKHSPAFSEYNRLRQIPANKMKDQDYDGLLSLASSLIGNRNLIFLLCCLNKVVEEMRALAKAVPALSFTLDEDRLLFAYEPTYNIENLSTDDFLSILRMVVYSTSHSMLEAYHDPNYLKLLLLKKKSQCGEVARCANDYLVQLLINEWYLCGVYYMEQLNSKLEVLDNIRRKNEQYLEPLCPQFFHLLSLKKKSFYEYLQKIETKEIVADFEKRPNCDFYATLYERIKEYCQKIEYNLYSPDIYFPISDACPAIDLQKRLDALELEEAPCESHSTELSLFVDKKAEQLISPFECSLRVTVWQDPAKDPSVYYPVFSTLTAVAKEKMRFDHGFAWIINWLAVKYGIETMRGDEKHYTLPVEVIKKGKKPYSALATFCFSKQSGRLYHRCIEKKNKNDQISELIAARRFNVAFPPAGSDR